MADDLEAEISQSEALLAIIREQRQRIETLEHDLACFRREYRSTAASHDFFHREAMAARPKLRAAAVYESALWHSLGGVWAIRKAYTPDRPLTEMGRIALDAANKIEATVLDAVYLVPLGVGRKPVRPFEHAPKAPDERDDTISWTREDGQPVFHQIRQTFTTWPDLERQKIDAELARFANGGRG